MNIFRLICCAYFILISITSTSAYAAGKNIGEEVLPVWEYLGTARAQSEYNPNGIDIIYAVDKASAKVHDSNNDFGFWLARINKEKNEIDMTYTRIAKNKSSYVEQRRQVFFLDGTFKFAEDLDKKVKYSLSPTDLFYNAQEVCKNKVSLGSTVEMPLLPTSANSLLLRPKGKALANSTREWFCFIDAKQSGLDPKDNKKCTLVTYAYNPEDRVYYQGTTYCVRTGPTTYQKTGGSMQLYTYEDKLLKENNKAACFVADDKAHKRIEWYYEMYRAK